MMTGDDMRRRHRGRARVRAGIRVLILLRVPDNFDEHQAISVVLADLNGDGVEDVALAGAVGDTVSILFALVSADDGFEVVEIHRDRLSRPDLDHSAVAVSWAEKATSIYHYEDGRFEEFGWRTC